MSNNDPFFDNTLATGEGWVISDCEGSENGPWQLQKCDEEEIFADDTDAWAFVRLKASEGSAYHLAALEYIKQRCPEEFARIMAAK